MVRPLLFVPLAMNQARFYAALDPLLARRGFACTHLSFHERSAEWLARQGLRTVNAWRHPAARRPVDPRGLIDRPLEALLRHEEAAFALSPKARAGLARRFAGHLAVADAVLDELGPETILVQELGGFVAVLAAYFAARGKGLDALFAEPSFFRGRVFFTRNSLAAPRVPPEPAGEPAAELRRYLEETLAAGSPVVPVKDTRHFRAPRRKLSDPYNLRRLAEKLVDKHLLRKREVFSHVGLHVRRHLAMALNAPRLRRLAQPLPATPFVYFPLHVPADVALTLRAPEWLDQLALCERLAGLLPDGLLLAIKEHPAMVGALAPGRVAALLRRQPRLRLLDARLNNFAVMRAASAVVTINSKSGAEAALLGRPAVALGDAFYSDSPLIRTVGRLEDVPAAIAAAGAPPSPGEIERYFQSVWERSRPGELYAEDPARIAVFADSLARELEAL